jgi:hypothetical protein
MDLIDEQERMGKQSNIAGVQRSNGSYLSNLSWGRNNAELLQHAQGVKIEPGFNRLAV